MFKSTVAVLGVFSAWVTIKYHASIMKFEIFKFEMCVLLQISFAAILPNIFKIGKNTQSNRKNKRVPVFWDTVYIVSAAYVLSSQHLLCDCTVQTRTGPELRPIWLIPMWRFNPVVEYRLVWAGSLLPSTRVLLSISTRCALCLFRSQYEENTFICQYNINDIIQITVNYGNGKQ